MILVDLWTLKVLHLCWNSHNTVFLFPQLQWALLAFFSACKLPNMAASPGAKDPVIKCEKQRYQGIFRELFFKHTREKTDLKLFLSYSLRLLQTYVVEGGWWYFLLVCGCPPCHVTTFHICYERGTN